MTISHIFKLMTFCIILCVGVGLSNSWAYEISDIDIRQVGETTYVTIKADGPVIYEDFMMDRPHRIVIDCKNAQNKVRTSILENLEAKGITAIRVGQRDLFEELPEPTVRIVIDLAERASYLILTEENNLIVAIDTMGFKEGEGLPTETPSPPESKPQMDRTSSSTNPSPVSPDGDYLPPVQTGTDDRPAYVAGDDFIVVENPQTPGMEEDAEDAALEEEKLISFDLIKADVRNVLRFLADYGNVNIVASNAVGGLISMRLIDVPWRRAMDLILDVSNFVAIEEEDGIIRVVTKNEFDQIERQKLRNQQELEELLPFTTEVIKVQYATASEIQPALSRVKSPKGSIQVDRRTNSIIMTDLPSYIEEARALLTKLDTYIPQVVIQAKVVSIAPNATKQFGINWSAGNFGNPLVDTHAEGETSFPLLGTTAFRFGTLLSTIDISAMIQMLEDQGQGETLSEPRITVLDNEEAKIHAGQGRTRTEKSPEGTEVTQKTEDIGVTLRVTPHVIADDKVLMDLYVEVSSIAPEAAGQELINKDDAETRVMVDNGATAVIGGLMSTDRNRSKSVVPFLGHLPVFGQLFRSERSTLNKRELMIFVTPTVIKPPVKEYERADRG
ncbi:MAG: type IV pilus secretin family protein [Gemmatimonadetes bacterium]|nr:MAG: type IV pilus secretin family protein [Gemmatimonadota bacterium]